MVDIFNKRHTVEINLHLLNTPIESVIQMFSADNLSEMDVYNSITHEKVHYFNLQVQEIISLGYLRLMRDESVVSNYRCTFFIDDI